MRYKVLFLADISSTHTRKWAYALLKQGVDVKVFSLNGLNTERFDEKEAAGLNNIYAKYDKEAPFSENVSFGKGLHRIKRLIKSFNPDIVHCHYATSYGLLGALSGFHPLIISVWGSDVFTFPRKSPAHKILLRHNLNKADLILSASKVMAEESHKYTSKPVKVIPFGIDTAYFKPVAIKNLFEGSIVIGTVKQLEVEYGIEYLIYAFKLLKDKQKELPLKLLVVGSGSQTQKLKQLVQDLGIYKDTRFTGFIPPSDVVQYHNMMSVSVFPSLQESFGVSVLEASACGKPVVVSNVGGLPEVVENSVTGIVVPLANPQQLADAIEKLVTDEKLRNEMGANGRKRVEQLFNWEDNVKQMCDTYKEIAEGKLKDR